MKTFKISKRSKLQFEEVSMKASKTLKFNLMFLCVFLLLFFMTANAVTAATYYVATNGNDNNNGSINAPFKTIQKAANTVSAGDTVHVRAGTYNQRVALNRSISPGAYITFQNYPGETAILDGTGLGHGDMIAGFDVSYYKIVGFKIRNYAGRAIAMHGELSHIEIRNNEIYNGNQPPSGTYGHAIYVSAMRWPGPTYTVITDVIIDNNYIHDVKTGPDEGAHDEALTVVLNVSRFQITNNILDTVNHIGIDAIGRGANYPHNGIIANNIVRNSGYGASDTGIYIDGAKNITIENNSTYNNRGHGIYTGNEDDYGSPSPVITDGIIVRKNVSRNNLRNISIGGGYYGTSQNARVVHNTAVTNTTGKQGNYYLAKGTGHVAKNNIGYFGSTGAFYMLENGWNLTTNPTLNYNNYYPASATGMRFWYGNNDSSWTTLSAYSAATGQDANSISTDPKFTNLGANDFTLQSDSPAIDAGDFLTRTTSSGSGTSVTVADARYFHGGYGISGVSGDTIRVGSNTVTVTGVNYSTGVLTVTPSISWNNNDGVSYAYSGSKPDIGAYEYIPVNNSSVISK